MLAFFLSTRVFNYGVPGWKHIISSDGRGYYAYLPALLIDRDLSFSGVAKREARLQGYAHYKPAYIVKSGGRSLNKYFAGESLLLLPFFLLAILVSWLVGTDIDGYSFFFQIFTGIGALFYLFAGFYFLKRILESIQIRPFAIAVTLIIILFGTNLFYYSIWQPTMSHVYSFFAINGFLWFSFKAIRGWNVKSASLMGVFLGFVCLIRPTNIIVIVLIPFLAGENSRMIHFLRAVWLKKLTLLLMVLIFLAIVSVQGVLWYIQTGRFFVWSYHGEGFRFFSPEIFNVLFSYRKGLFIYTPVLLVSMMGMIILLLRKQLQFLSITGFFILSTYIIASWWNWYYGDGFGLRAFIDYYGIFAILLAMVVNKIRPGTDVVFSVLFLSPFVLLNLLQTWQYTHQVIQPNSMNAVKYHHVFMKTDSAMINSLGGNDEIADYSVNLTRPVLTCTSSFEKPQENWILNSIIATSRASSGEHAGYLDSLHQFSPAIVIRAAKLGKLPDTFHVRGEIMIWDSVPGASNGALVVLSMDSIQPGENYWRGFLMNDIPVTSSKTWRKITFSLMLPEIANPDGILKIYIWNTGKKPMLVDDFGVRVFGRW